MCQLPTANKAYSSCNVHRAGWLLVDPPIALPKTKAGAETTLVVAAFALTRYKRVVYIHPHTLLLVKLNPDPFNSDPRLPSFTLRCRRALSTRSSRAARSAESPLEERPYTLAC